MTTLRQAAQQALEALENGKRVRNFEGGTKHQPTLEDNAITALRTALEQQAPFSPEAINTTQTAWMMGYEAAKAEQQAVFNCPRCGHVCSQRPWVDLTDGDWEWVADKKETSLDTFAYGAAWAADQLKEKNT